MRLGTTKKIDLYLYKYRIHPPSIRTMSVSIKTAQFIEKARQLNGERYNYSKVNYVNAKTKVTITCNIHGDFEQTPTNHLSGYGCSMCANNKKKTVSQFIEEARAVHGDRYDYSKVVYVNTNTPVAIICREHGEFMQIPDFHINRKTNCPHCAGGIADTTENFIKKAKNIHGEKYDYSKVSYVNNTTAVIIICPTHGEFNQVPFIHTNLNQRCGCPHCVNKAEYKMFTTLKTVYPEIHRQYKTEWCKNKQCLPFDFCIPNEKIIIELDGEQHFTPVTSWREAELQTDKDLFKMKCANDNGFSVIRISQKYTENNPNWLNSINETIHVIRNQKEGAAANNYFICEGTEYDGLKSKPVPLTNPYLTDV